MSVAPPAKLDGWKAIATHLGRNERTAQRWAHERGMPVHHVPGGRSGATFAWEAEIDAWLQADRPLLSEGVPGGESVTAAEEPGPLLGPGTKPNGVSTAASPSTPGSRPWRAVGVGAVLLAAGLAGVAIAMLRRGPPVVSRLQIDGATLEARDPQGQVAWRYEASVPESARQRSDGSARAAIWRSALVDLDADGRAEAIAFVTYFHAGGRTPAGAGAGRTGATAATFLGARVVCLTSSGTLRWAFDPRITLTFAGRRFDGPWHARDWLAPVVNGQPRLWVSFADETWWPSFVVALDANGSAAVQYVSAGHVYALARLDGGPTPIVLAGGVNNEYAAASMAALDAAGPPAASPQTASGAYYCDACPAGRPLRYFVFPRSELNRLSGDPHNRTEQIQVSGSQVLVSVFEGTYERTVYELSRTLDIESVGMSDRYWEAHRRLEREGRLTHSVEQCEEYTKGMPVRTWTPSTGWMTVWAKQAQRGALSHAP